MPPLRRCPPQLLKSSHSPLFPSSLLPLAQASSSRRPFSSTLNVNLRTSELTPSLLSSLRANPSRLWSDIHSTARFGTGNRYGQPSEETGLNRLALTPSDKQARDWFASTTEGLGCKLFTDEIGNQFAVRSGLASYTTSNAHASHGLDVDGLRGVSVSGGVPAATFAGSHLDSQPQGGRFDGILGVCAGIEMLRVLQENWIETEGPVGVVNWCNEEGKRWRRSMMGSGVWSQGTREAVEEVWGLVDEGSGRTVKEELESIGALGPVKASATEGVRMAGHFEVHIEQARRLERAGEKVAVVSGVQGYKWFTITVKGIEAHAGATPWKDRADAGYWASKAVVEISEMVKGMGALATVGWMELRPGSTNVVAGEVKMTLDVRCESEERLEEIISRVKNYFGDLEKRSKEDGGVGCQFELKQDFESHAMEFDPVAMGCVEESAKIVTGKNEIPRLVSGAGHDSVCTAKHCPTAMIFVPCKDGVTHNIREWCSEEDSAIGASVLLQSVLRFDQWRHKQGHFA